MEEKGEGDGKGAGMAKEGNLRGEEMGGKIAEKRRCRRIEDDLPAQLTILFTAPNIILLGATVGEEW